MAIVIMPECEGEELALGNGKLGKAGGGMMGCWEMESWAGQGVMGCWEMESWARQRAMGR